MIFAFNRFINRAMPQTTVRRGLGSLTIGFVILAVAVGATVFFFDRQQRAQRWVVHTVMVNDRLTGLLSLLQDAETGQRGYLLTGDPQDLQPYNRARAGLDKQLVALRSDVADNPVQIDNMAQLARCANERVRRLASTLDASTTAEDSLAGPDRQRIGRLWMDRCRAIISSMKANEQRLLETRIATARRQAVWISWWLVLSVLAIIALAFFAVRDARERLLSSIAARNMLTAVNDRLVKEAANREAAEAQLRQLQKMESIGQLTGGIAHDFNNMLAIVIGSLDMARRRLPGDPTKALKAIDNAMSGAQRAAQLTARLLAFSRQQPLAPTALDVNRLVSGMSELLRRTIGDTLRVETVLGGGVWTTFVDAGQLENALLNLCVNARDAMGENGRLTIETNNTYLDDNYAAAHGEVAAGQYVMVSVTDTGTGMPAEVIERAFDPFFTTKTVGKGTGLGLSQVYGFVKQSGGHVKIYSETGVGTTVKLYLPRHFGPADNRDPLAYGDAQDLPRALPGEVVLVVEDEERVRQLSVEALSDLGYVVVQAGDAAQALATLATMDRIDLLFTDIVMPEKNGRLLYEEARVVRPGLKVLYTTGYTRNAIVHNGMLDHDVDLLVKPFTVEQLAHKVRQVIDGDA